MYVSRSHIYLTDKSDFLTKRWINTTIELTYEVNIKEGDGCCLIVEYNNRNIEKVCTNASVAERKYGSRMAELIQQRIDEISAADSVEQMIQFHIGRCHPLKGDRKDQYAVDLVHPQRLVFEKKGSQIKIANIMEIVDYH